MKQLMAALSKALFRGLLVIVPAYLAVLVLLKGMKSVANLVRPFTGLLPDWLPAEDLLSLLLVLAICIAFGAFVGTRMGQGVRKWIEQTLFERIPGYSLFRSLTQQVAGQNRDSTWKAALVEIEEALVPAFIIEELDDGRYTVFVPSIPTPFAGAVYVLDRNRVHPVDVPFTDAVKVVSRWGSGAKDLVAAMEKGVKPIERTPGYSSSGLDGRGFREKAGDRLALRIRGFLVRLQEREQPALAVGTRVRGEPFVHFRHFVALGAAGFERCRGQPGVVGGRQRRPRDKRRRRPPGAARAGWY